jgi:hypothetical protein
MESIKPLLLDYRHNTTELFKCRNLRASMTLPLPNLHRRHRKGAADGFVVEEREMFIAVLQG